MLQLLLSFWLQEFDLSFMSMSELMDAIRNKALDNGLTMYPFRSISIVSPNEFLNLS